MITGGYRYRLDGLEVPVSETFEVDEGTGGTVVRSVRSGPGVVIAVEARYEPHGSTAEVRFDSAALSRVRTFAAPGDGTVLFPLLRVFAGPVLLAAAAASRVEGDHVVGGVRVLVPDIRDPADVDRLLEPLVDVRTAVPVPAATGLPPGAVSLEYRGGSYGEAGARFVVDAGGLLLGYRWEQPGAGSWEVDLVDLAGGHPAPIGWGG